jgi:hypothetical protein
MAAARMPVPAGKMPATGLLRPFVPEAKPDQNGAGVLSVASRGLCLGETVQHSVFYRVSTNPSGSADPNNKGQLRPSFVLIAKQN